MSYCKLCGRELEKDGDPLSVDCGGDCWGCIGELEARMGYKPSIEQVRREIDAGIRTDVPGLADLDK